MRANVFWLPAPASSTGSSINLLFISRLSAQGYVLSAEPALFLRAALAPSFPRAVLTFLGRWEIVLFRLAALAARLMFFRAAARCLVVVIGCLSIRQ